jgi:hypothetical protein
MSALIDDQPLPEKRPAPAPAPAPVAAAAPVVVYHIMIAAEAGASYLRLAQWRMDEAPVLLEDPHGNPDLARLLVKRLAKALNREGGA